MSRVEPLDRRAQTDRRNGRIAAFTIAALGGALAIWMETHGYRPARIPAVEKPQPTATVAEPTVSHIHEQASLSIEELISQNFKPENPLRESVLYARYPVRGAGFDSYLEQCSTYGGPEAIGVVSTKILYLQQTIADSSTTPVHYNRGDLVGYRLRLVVTPFNKRQSEVYALTEDSKGNLYVLPAIKDGTQLVKNNPGTECKKVDIPEDVLK